MYIGYYVSSLNKPVRLVVPYVPCFTINYICVYSYSFTLHFKLVVSILMNHNFESPFCFKISLNGIFFSVYRRNQNPSRFERPNKHYTSDISVRISKLVIYVIIIVYALL